MSAEPGRKRAYSTDVRLRVVYQRTGKGRNCCKNLNIATSTAYRIFKQFELSGDVAAANPPSCRPEFRMLDEQTELFAIGLIFESPTKCIYKKCVRQFKILLSFKYPPATICRLLHRYGITRKKVKQAALQRCYQLRGAFMAQCSLFSREQLVWIDETGSNAKDHIRKFGYAIRGITPVTHRVLVRGKRVNSIAALTSTGILAVETKVGTVDGHTFDFVTYTQYDALQWN